MIFTKPSARSMVRLVAPAGLVVALSLTSACSGASSDAAGTTKPADDPTYCTDTKALVTDLFTKPSGSAPDIAAMTAKFKAALQKMTDEAPAEVKPHLEVLNKKIQDTSDLSTLDSKDADAKAASDKADEWFQQHCHFKLSDLG